MNVATMTMPKTEAKEKLRAYKRNIERVNNTQHRKEYKRVAEGLRHLERGRKLIDLGVVFAECQTDAIDRPKLAVCRADQSQVIVRTRLDHYLFEATNQKRYGPRAASLNLALPNGTANNNAWKTGYALVPMVPIEHRPARFDPQAHHILWEVEQWADRPIGAKPDIDPYLLRHVGGMLYAVIAEWDLTDIERAVMASRAAI